MSTPTILLALTDEQRHTVVGALYEKLTETDHYLVSYRHDDDEPKATDSCCAVHLARFKERISQRDSLRERKALVEQTIALVETAESSEVPLQQQLLQRAGVEHFPGAEPADPELPAVTIFIPEQHIEQADQ